MLWAAFVLTFGFLVAEVIGGVLTRSLALISDAAHMFTDAAALAIALAAMRVARRPADARRSFGYHRFEILAAAFNALLLFAVAAYILYEAWRRLAQPASIESTGMLVVAGIGLVVNLISMRLLSGGKNTSLNVKGAYLEVWSDMLGSVGVIAGALVIRWTGWGWVDSAVAVAIGLWVLPRTWVLLKESLNVLLEGVPTGIDLEQVRQRLATCHGVVSIHELHVWSLTSGKSSLTAHAVINSTVSVDQALRALEQIAQEMFNIKHTTFQCEHTPCSQAENNPHWVEPRGALAAVALEAEDSSKAALHPGGTTVPSSHQEKS